MEKNVKPLIALACLLAIPLIAACAWLWQQWLVIAETIPLLANGIRAAIFTLPIAGLVFAGIALWRRYGWRESVFAHWQVKQTRAQVQVAPLATTYTFHPVSQNDVIPSSEAQLALPAPALDVGPLPAEQWLTWADGQAHILLGGKTKAGKTTTATAILARRLAKRETVYLIDPHSSDWLGLPTNGSISVDGELEAALTCVLREYMRRQQTRDEHKKATGRELPHNHFGRMTVLIDECNHIAELLPSVWSTFAKQLGSGSRKVGISLLLMAQSPLVEDLKMSGGMRENFARIALDLRSIKAMMDTTNNRERKAALHDALIAIGDDYPATAEIDAQVYLLDRNGLDSVIEPADAHTLVWNGFVSAPVVAPVVQNAPVVQSAQQMVSMPTLIPTTIDDVKVIYLIAHMLKRKQTPDQLAPVIASLIIKNTPYIDRDLATGEIEQRANRLLASGNVDAIASRLDRDALIKACQACGAGNNMAFAIYGGNRPTFLKEAKAFLDAAK